PRTPRDTLPSISSALAAARSARSCCRSCRWIGSSRYEQTHPRPCTGTRGTAGRGGSVDWSRGKAYYVLRNGHVGPSPLRHGLRLGQASCRVQRFLVRVREAGAVGRCLRIETQEGEVPCEGGRGADLLGSQVARGAGRSDHHVPRLPVRVCLLRPVLERAGIHLLDLGELEHQIV